MDILEKLKQLKDASLLKQSLVAVAIIAAVITFINNYSSVREKIKELIERVKSDENLKLFVSDVVELFRPFISGVEALLKDKGEKK